MLVGKESTWEEDHSNLGAGFGQLEDFCTSWVKNFDVNPRSGCSLFVRRLKDADENGGFCQNFCVFVSLHHQVASSQLAVVGGRDPDGLRGRTRAFNFSEQACTTDAKAEAIFSKITKIYIFMG